MVDSWSDLFGRISQHFARKFSNTGPSAGKRTLNASFKHYKGIVSESLCELLGSVIT